MAMKKFYNALLGIILFCSFSHAEIFYVSTMGNDSNDGKSWATAFADVQKAIDAAASVATSSSPAQVWIAKGTYTTSSYYRMRNNVEIYGGFAGTETKLNERVSGNESILTRYVDYVFRNSSINNTARLDSVTITGAKFRGIYNNSSDPTITNCTIYSNGDNGIYNDYYSSPTITNCTIAANDTGIYNDNSGPTITNCTISGNGGYGISNDGSSSPIITNCIIWGNSSQGIYNSSSSSAPSVSYCVIEGGYSGGTNIITEDPLLGGLGNYSGFVDTIPVLAGSSAIKKGTSTCAPEKDARGITRANPPCIGAFEASTQTPTAISLIVKEAIIVGRETEIIACSDGNPDEYILYKDGKEIARQNTNVFRITPTENGCYKYSVGVIYNGNEIMSEKQIEVRQISGNIIYVKQDGSDSNLGDSWDNAFADVQKAIDTASTIATNTEPAQVWIAHGTYTNAGGLSTTSYVMKNNVEIYGGFVGTETKLDERVSGNETILTTSGDYVFYNNYSSSKRLTNTARIDSVTITADSYGIYNYDYSSPTITNCTIAENGYAGINNQNSSSPTITNCTIVENSNYGIYSYNSSPTITNCTIAENSDYGISNGYDSNPTITNCIIWGNSSQGIYNSHSPSTTPSVSYCVIEGGYANGTNIITEDPLLGELGNYGGFVNTIPVLTGSSAIGAGTTGENVPATDARGGDRSAPPTIGAYEYVVQNSFDTWVQENKLTGDNAKPEAMPHSDGITNLEKFTFGLDASKPTSYAESGLFKQTSDGTNVSFQYPVNKVATDVSVKVLISEDLIHWTEVTATKLGASDNMDLFEVNKQIPEGGKLFFKVEINE